MAHTARHMPESWKEAPNQLSAINKAFIPTDNRSTGHSSDLKKKRKQEKGTRKRRQGYDLDWDRGLPLDREKTDT